MQIKYSGEHSVCDASCSVLEVLRSDSPLLKEKKEKEKLAVAVARVQ